MPLKVSLWQYTTAQGNGFHSVANSTIMVPDPCSRLGKRSKYRDLFSFPWKFPLEGCVLHLLNLTTARTGLGKVLAHQAALKQRFWQMLSVSQEAHLSIVPQQPRCQGLAGAAGGANQHVAVALAPP